MKQQKLTVYVIENDSLFDLCIEGEGFVILEHCLDMSTAYDILIESIKDLRESYEGERCPEQLQADEFIFHYEYKGKDETW